MKGLIKAVTYLKDAFLSIVIYIVGISHFILGTIVIFLTGIFTTGKLFEFMINTFSRFIIFLGGVWVKTEGRENILPGKKYIVMMNHVNIFDGFVLKSTFVKKVRGIEEETHMNWPIYGHLMKRIGMIPINRKNARKALGSLKKAAEKLNEQKDLSVGIMPEGTRTRNGKLSKFKRGGFLLALESGLDILPITQSGSYKIKQKTGWIIRPGKINVNIDESIPVKGYTKDNINELMEKVRNTMLKYVE
ncbi:MAG: lysophospholipid acyltransferase family protein [Acidobacteriota bacterium]